MRPITTEYFIANRAEDYEACKELWARHGKPGEIKFPVIMAKRGGQLIGFLGTHPGNQILAGPLFVETEGHAGIVAMRLIEGYEQLLKTLHISSYLFTISKKAKQWQKIAEELGATPYHNGRSEIWYQRTLDNGRISTTKTGISASA
jgi:hypothetical protein